VAQPVDPEALEKFHDELLKIRDAAMAEIVELETNPPESEEELLTRKHRAMLVFREISIMRVQVAGALGRD
jgi:hypothetical protein